MPAKASASASKKVVRKKSEPVEVEGVDEAPDTDAYVPDPEIGEGYISRKIHGKWDVNILDYALEHGENVLLMGDTGAGKTALGRAYAAKTGMFYYSLPCDVSIDPSALFGKIVPTEDGEFEWVDGPVTQLVRYGGVLNISEINFMPPRIAAALYPLLDSRRQLPLLGHRGEIVEAHPDLLIIADMNPQYRGTMDLNAAFKNRFALKIQWGYDKSVEKALIQNDPLLDMANKLRDKVGTEIRTPVATNMLMEFERFAESALGFGFAVENFLAAFDDSERGAVKNVFDLDKTAIRKVYEDKNKKAENEETMGRMTASVPEGEEEWSQADDDSYFEFEEDN